MAGMKPSYNPLSRGFYTVRDAARLIEVGSAQRILGWLRGYPGREIGPLLTRDFDSLSGQEVLSFLDLMEVRFVEHFREQGVKVTTLRRALETARKVFAEEKPLATSRIRFIASDDRRDVFAEEVLKPVAKQTDDTRLWSLVTRQYEIYQLIRERLARGVVFDPTTQLASRWTPRPERFSEIFLDPKIAYGQPVGPSLVPTHVLYDAWKAEGENIDVVSDWYEVPLPEAQRAVDFEIALMAPKSAVAA